MSSSTTWLASECDAPLHAQSDEALMELVQSNHHDAMGVLFSRYRRLVQNIAWRILRDNEEAEDLVQSVFLEMFQSAFLFDPAKGKAKVWMLQYAYHRAFSRKEYLRRRGLYSPRPQFCHEPAGKSETNFLLALESAQFVREAFAHLSGAERRIIQLAFYEGLTMCEAAERTGDSFASVRHHFYRGMRKLRTIFSERPGGSLEVASRHCRSSSAGEGRPRRDRNLVD